MSIGTGKDLADYVVDGRTIPYHIIDVVDAGYKYNVYEFQRDFTLAFEDICGRGKTPVLCGGTGLYIEAALKGYKLVQVPSDPAFRLECESRTDEEIIRELKSFKTLHNNTDIDNRRRMIRALEIERYYAINPLVDENLAQFDPLVIGVDIDRETRRMRIDQRLKARVDEGMIDEVRHLLNNGVPPETLIYYGLEYKYLTLYLTGQLDYNEFYQQLNIAIHQFAKRQMTWFRGMERRGVTIHWIDGLKPIDQRVEACVELINQHKKTANNAIT